MGFLVYNDYKVTIQDALFQQWIASNDAIRVQAEPRAQAKITEYLVQKYDLSSEFEPTTIFNPTATYTANTLVQLNYPLWVTGSAHVVNDLVSFTDGNCYSCVQNTTSAHEDPTHTAYWTNIGPQLGLYYIPYPYPVFDYKQIYNVGDVVFWKNKVYQCLIGTVVPTHYSQLQRPTYASQPFLNIFPDNRANGKLYWGAGIPYNVTDLIPNFMLPAAYNPSTPYTTGQWVLNGGAIWQALSNNTGKVPGTDIINWQPEAWTFGDNRNQSIVDAYVAITLFYLSPRISPRVTPQWVDAKYQSALAWLQSAAQGTITLAVPELQPLQGSRIRYGGNVKQQNGY